MRVHFTQNIPNTKAVLRHLRADAASRICQTWTYQNAPEVAPYTQGKEFYSYKVASGVPARYI